MYDISEQDSHVHVWHFWAGLWDMYMYDISEQDSHVHVWHFW
jgi:hypothetical protein